MSNKIEFTDEDYSNAEQMKSAFKIDEITTIAVVGDENFKPDQECINSIYENYRNN